MTASDASSSPRSFGPGACSRYEWWSFETYCGASRTPYPESSLAAQRQSWLQAQPVAITEKSLVKRSVRSGLATKQRRLVQGLTLGASPQTSASSRPPAATTGSLGGSKRADKGAKVRIESVWVGTYDQRWLQPFY